MNSKGLQFPALLINQLIDNGAKEEISLVEEKSLNRTNPFKKNNFAIRKFLMSFGQKSII